MSHCERHLDAQHEADECHDGLQTFRVVVYRVFDIETTSAREAVLNVVGREMTVDIADIDEVLEVIPQPDLTIHVAREAWT